MPQHRIVLFEWLTGPEFLLRKLVPEAVSVEARISDTADAILDKIPSGVDTFVFHINCTVTTRFPAVRKELVSRLQARRLDLINHLVTDVSKREIQQCCQTEGLGVTIAERTGDPDEALMVKTNLNFAGLSEWALSDSERTLLGIGKGSQLIWNSYHYFVLPRREVRDAWWKDDSLILERFVSNEAGVWYRAYVLRDRVVLCLLSSKLDVKKVGQSRLERTWYLQLSTELSKRGTDSPPEGVVRELSRFVRAFNLDFGTVDFVVDDEHQPFVIDVNTTPAYNHPVDGLVEHLAAAVVH